VDYLLGAERHGYLVPATGAVEVNGARIEARDGAAIADAALIKVTAIEDSEPPRGNLWAAQRGGGAVTQ
jgi:quercetin 2,3-dioxygenase